MTGRRSGPAESTPAASQWDDLDETDRQHLQRAIELGRGGWGAVHPNPMVGCVIVRNGRVVAEGRHEKYGEAHAEAKALALVEGAAKGATAYVSLEPCAHFGKTPPCTIALHSAGVARVVFWASDPGPDSGGGGDWLRQQGIVVLGPLGSPGEWAAENPFFFHEEREGLPYLAVKLAVSRDGGIAPQPDVQQWLTGPESRAEVHRIRAGFDAILVGARTWGADDPRLTVRDDGLDGPPPSRVLLDRKGQITTSARVFEDKDAPVWILTSPEEESGLVSRLGSKAIVRSVPVSGVGLDTRAVLDTLGQLGARTVLCEGGGKLVGSLLAEDVVRRFYLFRSPVVLGEGRVPAFPTGDSIVIGDDESAPDGWIPVGQATRYGEDILNILDRGE